MIFTGSVNDASVFADSDLGQTLESNEVDLPPADCLPNTNIVSPYNFVADGIFPLKNYIMKPFSRIGDLPMLHKVNNYRLSFGRRIIKCAFGQLAMVWRVHGTKLAWKLETSEKLIMSTLCLHNALIDIQCNEVGNR